MSIKEAMRRLGYRAADTVTGIRGTVISVTFDLDGNVRVYIQPKADKKGKIEPGRWCNIEMVVAGEELVAVPPKFEWEESVSADPSEA